MQPPRRAPYAHAASAFSHLHAAFYDPHLDPQQGLDVVQLWLNRGNCPTAVEGTAALVGAVVLDRRSGGNVYGQELQVRMAYSMALTRFVNTLVDSHQTGFFAQSIAAIATRIGLPLWLVELRHESTHAELPSLSLLRMGASQSLEWLEHRFWLPLLRSLDNAGPSSQVPPNLLAPSHEDDEDDQDATLEPELQRTLLAHIASYRDVQKEIARDESLRSRRTATVRRSLDQVRKTLGELVALRAGGDGVDEMFGARDRDDSGSGAGIVRARDTVIDALLRPGSLVPLSKKKRPPPFLDPSSSKPVAASIAPSLVAIWEPLLSDLSQLLGRSNFRSHLLSRIMRIVTGQDTHVEEAQSKSYIACLASWAAWIAAHWERIGEGDTSDDDDAGQASSSNPIATTVRECLARPTPAAQMLARALLLDDTASSRLPTHLRTLLDTLGRMGWDEEILQARRVELEASDDEDEAKAEVEMDVDGDGEGGEEEHSREAPMDTEQVTTGFEDDLEEMQLKLKQLREARQAVGVAEKVAVAETVQSKAETQHSALPRGWSIVPESEFTPRPIGCLQDGTVPRLALRLRA